MLNDLLEPSGTLRYNCGVRRGARKDSASGGASATGGASASRGNSSSGGTSASGRVSLWGGARARPVEVEDSGDDGEGGGEEEVGMYLLPTSGNAGIGSPRPRARCFPALVNI